MNNFGTQQGKYNGKKIKRQRRKKVSNTLLNYLEQNSQIINLINFSFDLAKKADETVKIASKALLPIHNNPEEREYYERSSKEGANAVNKFREFAPLFREIVLCRSIDNFLAYISNLLIVMHRSKHELLRSDEKISYQDILAAETREELIDMLIERRVINLGYKGFVELNDELNKRFKIKICETKSDLKKINELIETRNLFVHAGGVVNRQFLRKVPDSNERIGEKIDLTERVIDDVSFLSNISIKFDARVIRKFKIKETTLALVNLQDI